jgi:NadR type nicotinamide-nucleotide adenylyltransferase
MSKKYAFLGPESTGKSTLALEIANRIDGAYVQEYARKYLSDFGDEINAEIIDEIAGYQMLEEEIVEVIYPDKILICDTELITIQIWMEYLNYQVPGWITNSIQNTNYDKYFLCNIDLPWVADPLRKNEHDRSEIMQLFIDKLEFYKKNYVIINGEGEERIQNVMQYM